MYYIPYIYTYIRIYSYVLIKLSTLIKLVPWWTSIHLKYTYIHTYIQTNILYTYYGSSAAESNNDWCQTFDFLLGLVNFDRAFVMNSSSYVSTHKYIRNQYHSSYSAFNADWAQVVRTLIADPTMGVQEIQRKNVTASIISMRSLNFDSSIISDYAYALKEGFCSGTLDATLHNWYVLYVCVVHVQVGSTFIYICIFATTVVIRDKLAATPPATLVEPYLKCYRSKWFSFLDAAGVSMADCDLLMRSAAYTLLPLIYLLLKVSLATIYSTFTKKPCMYVCV